MRDYARKQRLQLLEVTAAVNQILFLRIDSWLDKSSSQQFLFQPIKNRKKYSLRILARSYKNPDTTFSSPLLFCYLSDNVCAYFTTLTLATGGRAKGPLGKQHACNETFSWKILNSTVIRTLSRGSFLPFGHHPNLVYGFPYEKIRSLHIQSQFRNTLSFFNCTHNWFSQCQFFFFFSALRCDDAVHSNLYSSHLFRSPGCTRLQCCVINSTHLHILLQTILVACVPYSSPHI